MIRKFNPVMVLAPPVVLAPGITFLPTLERRGMLKVKPVARFNDRQDLARERPTFYDFTGRKKRVEASTGLIFDIRG